VVYGGFGGASEPAMRGGFGGASEPAVVGGFVVAALVKAARPSPRLTAAWAARLLAD
jgi:hypothetical protein